MNSQSTLYFHTFHNPQKPQIESTQNSITIHTSSPNNLRYNLYIVQSTNNSHWVRMQCTHDPPTVHRHYTHTIHILIPCNLSTCIIRSTCVLHTLHIHMFRLQSTYIQPSINASTLLLSIDSTSFASSHSRFLSSLPLPLFHSPPSLFSLPRSLFLSLFIWFHVFHLICLF